MRQYTVIFVIILVGIHHHCFAPPSRLLTGVVQMLCRHISTSKSRNCHKSEGARLLFALIEKQSHLALSDEQRRIIAQSARKFEGVPGYHETIANLLHDTKTPQGFIYELEEALNLDEQGFNVVGFHEVKHIIVPEKPDEELCREFDIVARSEYDGHRQELLVECKTSSWQKLRPHYVSQFLAQQEIVETLNKNGKHTTESEFKYCVCSKHKFTPLWREWFDKNNIKAYEGGYED